MNAEILPSSPTRGGPGAVTRDDRDVRLAWVCLAASPVAFVLAIVVGEGTASLLGYEGVGVAPLWIAAIVLVLAMAVFCLPAVLATWFWRRGRARGDDRGKVPAVVLITLSAVFLALNLVSYVAGLLVE
jgi:hypothetical protein